MHASFVALVTAFFAAGSMAGTNSGWNPSQPPYPPPPPQKYVQLHPNGNWQKCLDVRGAAYEDGTPVDVFDCNGTGAQNWVINSGNTKVQVAGQPFCLDAGGSPNNGTAMKIWTCYDNLPAQNWYYTNDNRVALRDQGFCLDLTNGDTCSGKVMQIWMCTNGNANQVWTQ